MPSWQSHALKFVFRARRLLHRPQATLRVERERAQVELLATYFRTRPTPDCTGVDAGGVPAEWIITPNSAADRVVLFLHGGAYHSGSIKSHRSLAASIANSGRARVLLIEYRLAPENPFPAALADAASAYRWLLETGVAPEQLVVAGDSCGGGLALALLAGLREAGEPLPAAAVCLSPWTNLVCAGESWDGNASRDLLIDPEGLKQAAKLYLGNTDPRSPLASPIYANLNGLPPLLVQVGSDEILLSDATGLAERAEAAGVDVSFEVWKGMQHEWHFAADIVPEARRAIDRVGAFILSHTGSGA